MAFSGIEDKGRLCSASEGLACPLVPHTDPAQQLLHWLEGLSHLVNFD